MAFDDRDEEDLDISVGRPRGGANIPNYLVQSILVTLCCCLPFGIAAIVNAAQVNGHIASGNYDAAQRASDNAKKFALIGLVAGLIINVIVFFVQIAAEMNKPGVRF